MFLLPSDNFVQHLHTFDGVICNMNALSDSERIVELPSGDDQRAKKHFQTQHNQSLACASHSEFILILTAGNGLFGKIPFLFCDDKVYLGLFHKFLERAFYHPLIILLGFLLSSCILDADPVGGLLFSYLGTPLVGI